MTTRVIGFKSLMRKPNTRGTQPSFPVGNHNRNTSPKLRNSYSPSNNKALLRSRRNCIVHMLKDLRNLLRYKKLKNLTPKQLKSNFNLLLMSRNNCFVPRGA